MMTLLRQADAGGDHSSGQKLDESRSYTKRFEGLILFWI